MDTFVHISSSSDYMSLKDLDFKEDLDMLFNAILELKDIDECYKFFEYIATINELRSISQRLCVAKMLTDKNVYTEIAEKTRASTATISRVNKCLNYGQGGYGLVLERLKAKEGEN